METQLWLMLNFSLPKEPSRVRVSVWRKLKKSGSVNIGQSTWLLPMGESHEGAFKEISEEILLNSGVAYISKAEFVSTGNKADVRELFNRARDEEYNEFIDKCEVCQREIEKETKKQNFIFAEIEENEREIHKLTDWLAAITERDFFGAPLAGRADEEFKKCQSMLDEFCAAVYDLDALTYTR